MPTIHWPPKYTAAETAVHASNEIVIDAPLENIWAWLIRATLWPTWYPNSKNVVIRDDESPDLELGSRFQWKTFGVTVESVVLEFIPYERIGWTASGFGLDVYHAWVMEPANGGIHVLTQEHQNGFMCRAQSICLPNRMHKQHQIWLEGLAKKAATKPG